MTNTNDAFVKKIIEANPRQSAGSTGELFAAFVREAAPVIEFLEQQGIACSFFSSHSFGQGWSVGFMPETQPSAEFVVRKWRDAPAEKLEVVERGIIQREASTPEGLLNYARKKLGVPAP